MTNQSDAVVVLLELAERCEKAEGPDRELDQDIHEFVVIQTALSETSYPNCKRYTASVDAAMTLVPEELAFELTTTGFKPGATVCGSSIFDIHEGAYAATPALALCAAALRARSAGGEKG